MQRWFAVRFWLGAVMTIGALAVALYLGLLSTHHQLPQCTLSHCEVVLSSAYAHVLGLDVAWWGVIGLSLLLICFASTLVTKKALPILLFGSAVGSIAALWFVSVQFFILHAVCQYCLTIESLTILITLLFWPEYVRYLTRPVSTKR